MGMQGNVGNMQRQLSVPDNSFQPSLSQQQPPQADIMYQRQLSAPNSDFQPQMMMPQFQGQMGPMTGGQLPTSTFPNQGPF